MKRIAILIVCALALLGGERAYAAELCAGAETENVEYIIRLKESACVALDGAAEAISESERIYVTADRGLIGALTRQDALAYCVKNETATLFDYAEDCAALQKEFWNIAILGTDYARKNSITGAGVRVGIIDSGLMESFPGNTAEGTNFTVAETSPLRHVTKDTRGHGTFVASIIYNMAPDAVIVPLKCFNDSSTTEAALLSAIYAVIDEGCDVVNMSFGMTEDNVALREAVEKVRKAGIVMVAASGNLIGSASTGNDALMYPAAYDGVIGVGSLDSLKRISQRSYQNSSVWVTAPGVSVWGMSHQDGEYISGSGTSFAAPAVAGAAALAISADSELTSEGFAELIAATAEDLGAPGRDNSYGHGLLNVGLMLAAVRKDVGSFILSWYNGSLCLSAWLPKQADRVAWLAKYGQDGRFQGLQETGSLNNRAYGEPGSVWKLMVLDRATLSPLGAAKRYG